MIFVILILDFAISWFNAWSVGRYWSESKQMGGAVRFNVVIGYIMSIVGFTWVYVCLLSYIIAGIGPSIFPKADIDYETLIVFMSNLGYIIIAPIVIATGFAATVQSWVNFWKNRTLANGAVMAWNTYAEIRNTVNFARYAPSAIGKIFKIAFGGRGKKGNAAVVILGIVLLILAFAGGYFTASAILKRSDRNYEYDFKEAYKVEEPPASSPQATTNIFAKYDRTYDKYDEYDNEN